METAARLHTPLDPQDPTICSASCPACSELRRAGKPDRTRKIARIRSSRLYDPRDFEDNFFTRDQ